MTTGMHFKCVSSHTLGALKHFKLVFLLTQYIRAALTYNMYTDKEEESTDCERS